MKLPEHDVARLIGSVSISELQLWVREGWIVPGGDPSSSNYDEVDVARAKLIYTLREECALPDEAVPVVPSLLDQIHGLRREIRNLASAIDAEPEDVRNRIRSHYRGGSRGA